jgi:hypothetical protein
LCFRFYFRALTRLPVHHVYSIRNHYENTKTRTLATDLPPMRTPYSDFFASTSPSLGDRLVALTLRLVRGLREVDLLHRVHGPRGNMGWGSLSRPGKLKRALRCSSIAYSSRVAVRPEIPLRVASVRVREKERVRRVRLAPEREEVKRRGTKNNFCACFGLRTLCHDHQTRVRRASRGRPGRR